MADEKDQIRELAEAAAQAQRDLAAFGRVTQQTQNAVNDAQMKAKYGIENFTAGTAKAADGIAGLASAGIAAGKAMLDGKKGAAAFNSSLDSLSSAATAAGAALALMIPGGILIKGLIAGITAATTAFIKYEQAANEMADKLHKGYQGLSKAGGAAADGMTGVFRDAKKLGLSMNELDQMVSLVSENSKDFALFAGSVSQGRKKFADLSEAMAPARRGLMNLGMDMKDINEGTAAYLRMQTRTGRAQQMTTDQLAKGAQDYLKEMDGLTKLTGQSRSEMQAQRDRMLQQEQSAAKLRAMEMAGNKDGADALKQLGNMLGAAGPKMQAAFNASITGNLASKEAQEANLASQGELARVVELVQNKQISAAEGAQRVAKAMGHTADTVGTQLGQLNAYESSGYGNFAEQQNLRLLAESGFTKNLREIKGDQEKQIAGADKITDQQSALVLKQMEANAAMEKFVFAEIPNAQKNMIKLAEASLAAARALNRLAGEGLSEEEAARKKTTDEAKRTGMVNENLTNDYGMDFGQLSGEDGGIFKGPSTGYPVLMHGTEAIVPMDKLTNAQKLGNFEQTVGKSAATITGNQSAENPDADKMEKFAKAMLKDSESLTKLTDTDLKRTKNFSVLQAKLFEKKTALMEDELELLDEQNEMLEKMVEMAEKTGGKDAAAAMRKQLTLARMNMGGGGGGMGGGQGLQLPTASPVAGMGGGQGLQAKSQADLVGMGLKLKSGDVQAEGAGISPSIIELAKQVQSGVPGFNVFTGFNDKFHSEKAPSSQHTKGLAMDFTVAEKPTPEQGAQIVAWLKQAGASLAIDEYNNPSGHATAGHFHAQVPAFKDGGLVDEATLSMIGEAGPEAVIPLKDGNVPVSFNGKIGLGDEAMSLFKMIAEQSTAMTAMMQELVSAQKNSVDMQSKMLRAQS